MRALIILLYGIGGLTVMVVAFATNVYLGLLALLAMIGIGGAMHKAGWFDEPSR